MDLDVPLTCPGCKRQFKQKLSRLKNNSTIACSGCGKPITIKGDGAEKVARSLKGLSDAFKKLGRR